MSLSNKFTERFCEIEAEVAVVQEIIATNATVEAIQTRLSTLEAKQIELKKTVLHLMTLSKLRNKEKSNETVNHLL